MIEEAIVKGRHLLDIATTAERLTIMGSAYKKLARVETDSQKVNDHLRQAAAYYRKRPTHNEVRGWQIPIRSSIFWW